MLLVFPCPKCEETVRREIGETSITVECSECDWTRSIPKGDIQHGRPQACLVCGCEDLWRQKDFPPQLGLTMVGLGALFSTIAWTMYWPVAAIVILMGFAGIDFLLYWLMPDVLVCYRCESRHRRAELDDEHPRFDLEVAEQYCQEAIRLEEAGKSIT